MIDLLTVSQSEDKNRHIFKQGGANISKKRHNSDKETKPNGTTNINKKG